MCPDLAIKQGRQYFVFLHVFPGKCFALALPCHEAAVLARVLYYHASDSLNETEREQRDARTARTAPVFFSRRTPYSNINDRYFVLIRYWYDASYPINRFGA